MRGVRPFPWLCLISITITISTSFSLAACGQNGAEADSGSVNPTPDAGMPPQGDVLTARVVAVNIPGISALTQVGPFLSGGPIHDKANFAALTVPGAVLDPVRLLVLSASNFGARKAIANQAEGSAISIDPTGSSPIEIPGSFAAGDGQVSALGGKVILFAAQSKAFLNKVNNPTAVTATQAATSNPRGLSINNGFGRIWFANTPTDASSDGSITISDANGPPLAAAPNPTAGGVFMGAVTNRTPRQVIPGSIDKGAIATALLGVSSDLSGKAVFAAVLADGSIVQVHTLKGVDGLAPAGTIAPISNLDPHNADAIGADPTRVGMIMNWTPNRVLYITDPMRNQVVSLTLTATNGAFLVSSTRQMQAAELSAPIDLTPVIKEIAAPKFSSATTCAGGSDFYVADRGDGTIVRMRQDGTVVAKRSILVPDDGMIGAGRLNGISVSSDATRIWVSISGSLPSHPGQNGVILELPAFGAL